MPIHSIWRCLKTFYTSNIDVGCSQWWFAASTMTPQHDWAPPYPNFFKFAPHLHRYNSETVHPYAHPQHIMALKYCIYMQIYITWPILFSDIYYYSVEELVQGQSLVKPSQSLVQSLIQKNADFGGLVGKEVVIFFNQTLQGSYWELFEGIWLLWIGPGAIWKNDIYIFSCGPPINGARTGIGIFALLSNTSMGTVNYRYWHQMVPVPVLAFMHFGPVPVLARYITGTCI